MSARRYFAVAIGISCSASFGLLACGDDDDSAIVGTGTDAGGDASNVVEDTGTGGSNDSGSDAGKIDAGDAGKPTDAGADADAVAPPTFTDALRSSGHIRLAHDLVIGEFYVDDLEVRWSNSTECTMLVRTPAKAFGTAGTITIGGGIVGQDGGPTAAITIPPPSTPDIYLYAGPDTILPFSNEFTVDIDQGPTADGFPALTPQTLVTSLNLPLSIKTPTFGATPLEVPVTKPFELTWTPPAGPGDLTKQRVLVDISVQPTASDSGKVVNLYCAFPVTAGKASIPGEILADMKARSGGGETVGATLTVYGGGQSVVTVKNAMTYIIEAALDTSFDNGTQDLTLK